MAGRRSSPPSSAASTACWRRFAPGSGLNLIRERIVDTLGPDSGVVYRPVKGLEPADVALAWLEGNDSDLVAEVVRAAREAFGIEPEASPGD